MLHEALKQTNLTAEETRALEKALKQVKTKFAKVVTNAVIYGSTIKQSEPVKRKDLNVLVIMNQKDNDVARSLEEVLEQVDKKIKLDLKILSLEEYVAEAHLESSFYRKVTQEGVEIYKNDELLEPVSS
ncbi:hypothetical protein LGV61_08105 [Desulfurispirillum indicum]|uniref:DNA polymerase beta domain protein region n=1 Tax=Desulfurispirillum indicum (strain ATCC BAA-1389 / DSM 22839 / S5) TaxID=653733 RepID=E6W0E2_DESIS|nr:hypothetical protein [Desulfurispirillum indicum]ADU66360.1 hypothetical protein Selin_1630 [Desulfurispirillum indicum S5]UCZ55694.1 hypothetical protein LGV61_08105 [Desulfurispirillum indicum]